MPPYSKWCRCLINTGFCLIEGPCHVNKIWFIFSSVKYNSLEMSMAWFFLKIRFFNIFWDDAKMRCPNQICRLFICFDLVWANVNTGNECFDQSEFVLIWNLAQNSKVAPNICIIPPFFKKSYLYLANKKYQYKIPWMQGSKVEARVSR